MTRPVLASEPPEETREREGRRWLMLAVLLLGQFMGLLDVFIVNVAMPAIGADLHASGASLQLVVGGYTAAYAMLLITGARLGTLYGRRRMYLLGVIVFTTMSLVCGLAPGSGVLIGSRFLQGAGAAVMVPQIMSLIQTRFTGPARAKALSAYGAVLSLGSVAGLIIGGLLVSADLFGLTWRPAFLVNVPLGVILAVLVPRLVPADETGTARRLDVAGLVIATSATFLIVLPLVLGREAGWPAWSFGCVAAGIVLAGVFIPVERRIAARGGDPLLDPAVLRTPGVGAGIGALAAMQVGYGGFLFVCTLHLEAGLGDSALRVGLTYLPMAATFGLVGFSWRALPATTHRVLPPIGLALCGVAYLGISAAVRDGANGGTPLWAALAADGIGMGLSVSPLLTRSLLHVRLSQAADASGLLTTTMQLGQVLGVAAFGTVFLALRDHAVESAHASATALSTSGYWLALLAAIGLIPAVALSRNGRKPVIRDSAVNDTNRGER
ncbi:MFS transporter [Actinoallomurus vinaceus]|uniref:MFS transporter n=1 Tax=Actinoallomurus vinaceus TaxID=1080074 RepID=A0ABP8UFB8_9ACTN